MSELWLEEREKFMGIATFLASLLDTRGRSVCSYDEAHDLLGPLALKIGFVEWARTPEEYARYNGGVFGLRGILGDAEEEARRVVAGMTPDQIQECVKRLCGNGKYLPHTKGAETKWTDPT